MKQRMLFGAALIALAALFGAGCDRNADDTDSRILLRGTWETNTPPDYFDGYKGKIVITSDTITVTGYTGSISGGAATRPFLGVTKGAALPGYSEKTADHTYPDHEGMLFVKDAGVWLPGIAYSFYRTGSGSPYQYFLRFSFGGREETLRKTGGE